ncbi:ethanolamine ammonia-lyase subunit EutB [Desulfoluna sp.]|uniref:ethanolamine ammonia-lyase subunit EutB n=1 Tax=Desulfoluna sp. TaxID=2045199 RepID=UPI0026145B75|nr:ethanolamine ammonia-lyase subunit EutB [Desulfoluna sp.]
MRLKTTLFGSVYEFKDLYDVMAKANEEKSGDRLAGVAAESVTQMVAAKEILSNITLADIRNNPAVPYEDDEVTRLIQDDLNEKIYGAMKNWTVAELREWILANETTGADLLRASRGLTSEMIAAVTKLMSNLDLVYGAKKITITAHCNTTIGLPGTLAWRLQPNHTTDDPDGIRISTLEGLSYGSGDAVIGLNPVNDTTDSCISILTMFREIMDEYEIPTQNCVLAHITTQMDAIRKGAPCDMIFQSIAGSQKGNEDFGVSVALLSEAEDLMRKEGTSEGPNVMYFETGQGSELSSGAHHGVDQLTMEARCYGLARHYKPFMVNTVVGFIGPEYLYDSKQVTRAALEDHFMGKLSGISMGVDACYTNHMKADQNDVENLGMLLCTAGVNYLISVPQGDDIMLNYQCPGYHEVPTLRELMGLRPVPEFEAWLEKMGLWENGKMTRRAGDASLFIR